MGKYKGFSYWGFESQTRRTVLLFASSIDFIVLALKKSFWSRKEGVAFSMQYAKHASYTIALHVIGGRDYCSFRFCVSFAMEKKIDIADEGNGGGRLYVFI